MTTMTASLRREVVERLSCAALLLGAAWVGPGSAAVTDAFTAHFDVKRGAIPLGTSTFRLVRGPHDGCYIYTGRADPNALARLFVGHVRDRSRFCIRGGQLRSSRFSHRIEGDAEKSYTLAFDWDAHAVTYRSEAGAMARTALGRQALDPLSIQIAARRWIAAARRPDRLGTADFTLVDEDEIKTYSLRASDGGDVDTPAGRYATVLVERVDNPDRRLRFWLARNADWIPVQVEIQKSDAGVFRMALTQLQRRQR